MSSLLSKGLKILEFFHDKKFHLENREKDNVFVTFMKIFSYIPDEALFRDIINSKIDIFMRILIKFTNECFEYCLQGLIITPFYSMPTTNTERKTNWISLTEILFKKILEVFAFCPDILPKTHEYHYLGDNYHFIFQKLSKIPYRCLNRYKEDSFISSYYKQFLVVLIKRTRNSFFNFRPFKLSFGIS